MNPHQSQRPALDDRRSTPAAAHRRHGRRPALATLVGCLLLVGALGRYTYLRRTTPLDLAVDRVLHPLANRTGPVLDLLVHAATPRPVLALCLGGGLVLLATGQVRRGAVCVLGPTSALVASSLLQELLRRPSARILHSADAYPSGHMTAAVALATVCWVVAGALVGRHRVLAQWLRTSAALYACAVGLALTGLRHHYVTDTVGGAAVALAGLALAWGLLRAPDEVSPAGTARS